MISNSKAVKGQNVLTPPPSVTWYEMLFDKFKDPIIIILIVADIFSFVVNIVQGEPMWEPLAILTAILITTLVGWYQDMSSKAQFDSLNKVSDNDPIKVVRDNVVMEVPKCDICEKDEVILSAGDEVCADMLLIEAVNIHCDESCMTGESEPVVKSTVLEGNPTIASNTVLRGTTITEGNGRGYVLAVGDATEIGKTTRQAHEITDEKTPLTVQLENLADKISKLSFWIGGILLVFLNAHHFFCTDFDPSIGAIIAKELGFIMTAVVIIIAAVPEGLALSVVLALAYSVKAMMKDNNLVKKMKATETVGAVNIIFSDKTGTLTQNKMTVVDTDVVNIEKMQTNGAVNSTANLGKDGNVLGNPTEGAILKWINDVINYLDVRKATEIVEQKPFNSTDKYMMSATKTIKYYKGAPEVIAKLIKDNSFLEKVAEQQARGRRAISFASKEKGGKLTYDGTVFIEDPVRVDVPNAVANCYKAGVDVVMMTGDNVKTAKEIATQAGFKNPWAIEAKDFDAVAWGDPECGYPNVIARCKPEDKLHILKEFQKLGYICAMTGDGRLCPVLQ